MLCGWSGTCASGALKDVIGLSMVVAAGVLGNANNAAQARKKKPIMKKKKKVSVVAT